jgi:hypothetical protein
MALESEDTFGVGLISETGELSWTLTHRSGDLARSGLSENS